MSRSVPEWIADHDDQAIPKAVKLRIWERERGRCHLTGRKIRPGDIWQYEHKKPLWAGGEHRETNIFLALDEPHKEKTKEEDGIRYKADRTRAKHLGIHTPKGRPMPGTKASGWKRKIDGTVERR